MIPKAINMTPTTDATLMRNSRSISNLPDADLIGCVIRETKKTDPMRSMRRRTSVQANRNWNGSQVSRRNTKTEQNRVLEIQRLTMKYDPDMHAQLSLA